MPIIPNTDERIHALMKILGIPIENTIGFTLRCYVNEVVTVVREYYPESELLPKEITFKKSFRLEEIEEKEDGES